MKDEDVLVQQLQKANFNLKLRIFYLEERLAQRRGERVSQLPLEEELFAQKLITTENAQQLEDRNMLLVKSRNAIESLHGALELARAQYHELRESTDSAEVIEANTELLELQASQIAELEAQANVQESTSQDVSQQNDMLRTDLAQFT